VTKNPLVYITESDDPLVLAWRGEGGISLIFVFESLRWVDPRDMVDSVNYKKCFL